MAESLRVLIEEAEFKESFRGYDRNQVDDLLEQIGSRVAALEAESSRVADMVRSAEERARAEADAQVEERVRAEVASRPDTASAPSEEEAAERLRRTLVLAQRTADAAIEEAREEAQGLLERARQDAEEVTGTASSEAQRQTTEAREEAERLAAEAREEAERVQSEANDEAQRQTTEAREEAERVTAEAREEAERVNTESVAKLAEETTRLEATRKSLTVDIALLEHHVDEQRQRLRESLTALQRLLEEPGAFEVSALGEPAPEPHDIAEADDVDDVEQGGDADDKMLVTSSADGAAEAWRVDDTVEHGPPEVFQAEVPHDDGHELATAPFQAAVVEPIDEEDGFLLELRKAMTDEQPPAASDDRSQEPAGKVGGQHPQAGGKQGRVAARPQKFGRRR